MTTTAVSGETTELPLIPVPREVRCPLAPPAEFGSGEGGYLGMIPGADTGTSQAQRTLSTAHQLESDRVAK